MPSRSIHLPMAAILMSCAVGADWRQFRGSDSSGVALHETVPTQFGPEQNMAWKADLPGRGLSSPIVIGGRVFVTAAGNPRPDRLHVLAFDARTGRKLWQRNFWATGPTASHPKTNMAAPTPTGDEGHVVALFGTDDVVCLDPDGRVLWVRSLHEENPGATDGRGLASSPLLIGTTVVVQIECQNTSFAVGIDLHSGANRWRVNRPRSYNWTSPIVLPAKVVGTDLVLVQGENRLSAYDPGTGREVWGLDRKNDPVASSVVAGDLLLVPGETSLAAFALSTAPTAPRLLWEKPKLNPETASPVVLDGRIYSLRGSILVSGNLKTGEVLDQVRLKGTCSSTPVGAGGLVYCFTEDGVAQVVRPGAKGAAVAANSPMKETILCTPAIADGALYVRSDGHLWKIAATNPPTNRSSGQ
jgi:outer membrane protein assembly factor BamB